MTSPSPVVIFSSEARPLVLTRLDSWIDREPAVLSERSPLRVLSALLF